MGPETVEKFPSKLIWKKSTGYSPFLGDIPRLADGFRYGTQKIEFGYSNLLLNNLKREKNGILIYWLLYFISACLPSTRWANPPFYSNLEAVNDKIQRFDRKMA